MTSYIYDIPHAKVLLYVSRILFPTYPGYYFPCYMVLQYCEINSRKKEYHVLVVPDKLLSDALKRTVKDTCVDVNNCIVMKAKSLNLCFVNVRALNKLQEKFRVVQAVELAVESLSNNEMLLSETLHYNIKCLKETSSAVIINSVNIRNIKTASEVDISQVNSHCDISSLVTDTILKRYFCTPRLLYKNDIISIHLTEYGAEFLYTYRHLSELSTIYFKCNRIDCGEDLDCEGCYICVADETCLKQSANVQSFIPQRHKTVLRYHCSNNDDIKQRTIDSYPYGLSRYFQDFEASVTSFLSQSLYPY